MNAFCVNTYISKGLVPDQHLQVVQGMLANQLHSLAL